MQARRRVHADRHDLEQFEAAIRATAVIVEPVPLPSPVSRDPDDDSILGLLVAAGAEVIVTRDRDLLVLRAFRGIPIVSPRDFLQRHAHRDPT